MARTPDGWKVFDEKTPVLTYLYSFGPGTANALAVGGADGLLVVSPPSRVMVKDKAALRRWLAREFEQAPPRWLIPAQW
jgi:hypothetical protein